MINPGRKILKAWFERLDGNVMVDGNVIPGFRTDVPSDQTGHYYILRLESSTGSSNNQSFVTNPVVVLDIVTQFDNKIDDTVAIDISTAIDELIFVDPSHHGLPAQAGIQIVSVTKQNETILPEDDGSMPKINRLAARYSHRVLQLDES